MRVVVSAPEVLCFDLENWDVLPLKQVAERSNLCEQTLQVWASNEVSLDVEDGPVDTKLSLAEIRSRVGADVGTEEKPFFAWGYHGPLQPGFSAKFTTVYTPVCLEMWSSCTISTHLRLFNKRLHGSCTGRYHEEETSYETGALSSLAKLRSDRHISCPSLPELLVEQGWLLSSGHEDTPQLGDAFGLLMKPRGVCVKGMPAFSTDKLHKAAFDLLLALYHLFLEERAHRKVKLEHIVYVKEKNQFVLVDLSRAYEGSGQAADAVDLVLCLAQMRGWSGSGDYAAATSVLQSVSRPLGCFASYVKSLKIGDHPDYTAWLVGFGKLCDGSIDMKALLEPQD